MSNQSNQNNNATRQWGSRFGYLMVAAGAAIGLGNIWRFPYLAYEGGGGVFLVVYIIVVILMGHPMVEMETAIGRYTGKDTVTCFQRIHKKWGFAGWMAVVCTTLLCMYYVVVGGWVAKYAFQYIVSGDFGSDKQAYYDQFTDLAFAGAGIFPVIFWHHQYGGKDIQGDASPAVRPADHLRDLGAVCQ